MSNIEKYLKNIYYWTYDGGKHEYDFPIHDYKKPINKDNFFVFWKTLKIRWSFDVSNLSIHFNLLKDSKIVYGSSDINDCFDHVINIFHKLEYEYDNERALAWVSRNWETIDGFHPATYRHVISDSDILILKEDVWDKRYGYGIMFTESLYHNGNLVYDGESLDDCIKIAEKIRDQILYKETGGD